MNKKNYRLVKINSCQLLCHKSNIYKTTVDIAYMQLPNETNTNKCGLKLLQDPTETTEI